MRILKENTLILLFKVLFYKKHQENCLFIVAKYYYIAGMLRQERANGNRRLLKFQTSGATNITIQEAK